MFLNNIHGINSLSGRGEIGPFAESYVMDLNVWGGGEEVMEDMTFIFMNTSMGLKFNFHMSRNLV